MAWLTRSAIQYSQHLLLVSKLYKLKDPAFLAVYSVHQDSSTIQAALPAFIKTLQNTVASVLFYCTQFIKNLHLSY